MVGLKQALMATGHVAGGALAGLGTSFMTGRSSNQVMSKATNKLIGTLFGALAGTLAYAGTKFGDNVQGEWVQNAKADWISNFQDKTNHSYLNMAYRAARYVGNLFAGMTVANTLYNGVAAVRKTEAQGLLTVGRGLDAWYKRAPFNIVYAAGLAMIGTKVVSNTWSYINSKVGPANTPAPAAAAPVDAGVLAAAKAVSGVVAADVAEAILALSTDANTQNLIAYLKAGDDGLFKNAEYTIGATAKVSIVFVPKGKVVKLNGAGDALAAYPSNTVLVYAKGGFTDSSTGAALDMTKFEWSDEKVKSSKEEVKTLLAAFKGVLPADVTIKFKNPLAAAIDSDKLKLVNA